MKMDATSRSRWRCVATVVGLVCVAAQLSVVASMPAPPDVSGAQSFFDTATPPPITEDELHQMVEQLLMEAYGDEYEPPPPRLKAKSPKVTASSSITTSTTSSTSGSPQAESVAHNGITESLLLLQQQQKMIEIQEQRQKLQQMQKQLQVEQQQQLEEQRKMFRQATNTLPPITKGSLILRQQLKQSPRNVQTSVPTLEKPRVLHGKSTSTTNVRITTRPSVRLQPTAPVQSKVTVQSKIPVQTTAPLRSTATVPSTIPVAPTKSTQPSSVTTPSSKPRGIPTSEELQKALIFKQENQPGVLIVDRRKKSKTEKSKGARRLLLNHRQNNHQARGRTPTITTPTSFTPTPSTTTATMQHINRQSPSKQVVLKRGRSSSNTSQTPPLQPMHSLINKTSSPSVVPPRSLKRETKPESLAGDNLASRNGRSPQQKAANQQQQQVERKAPVIESAKLLSHIVSEDMRPFQKVQAGNDNRQQGSSSAPRPFTLPSPVNNPAQIQRVQQQQQQKPLSVDISDKDLMMLQLLGSQLNQASRVQSTQNLQPSQPQNNVQVSSNNQQPANVQFVMQPRRNKDDNRIVINLGNMAKQLQSTGVPLPMNVAGNSRNNDQAKAISPIGNDYQDFLAPTAQKLNPVSQSLNQRMTVGDLVMSLNGQNGIRVISLGDLRNDDNSGSFSTNNDANLLQQLRNAMISGNINTLPNQQLNVGVPLPNINQGSQLSNVGVPLPTIVNQNQQGSNSVVNGNAGRQFDFLFGNDNQNSQTTVDFNSGGSGGGGVINDLLFDASISVGRPGDSIPQSGGAGSLDDFFVNANSGSGAVASSGSSFDAGAGSLDDIFGSSDVGVPLPASTAQDPLPDTFAISDSGTDEFDLEDNTDFDFGSYEDDFPPLPPQPPNVFRTGISDIFFTKGQWIGTLLGGLFDVGSAVGSSVSKLFKKGSDETST